ncbi:SRPBCC domain-containing protein [Cupriavidus campinensis]
MTTATESTASKLAPLTVARAFNAPKELVFQAWTSAEHIRHWFCPAAFTIPEADIDFRVGGKFDFCMRSPEGDLHWVRGHYVEIVPNARLVLDLTAVSDDGTPLFNAYTTVSFEGVCGGTQLEVTQRYTMLHPSAGDFTRGAEQGWAQTLDRLEGEVARMAGAPVAARSVVHGMFTIERTYNATPAQVFHALTDPDAKARWFRGGDGYKELARTMDVRPGGREHLKGGWPNGLVSTFDAIYYDVIPGARIVYAYEMHLGERKISVSLATLEMKPAGSGTRLVMTEQGAFLDGYDDAGSREHGSGLLLDGLGTYLETVAR